MCMYNFHFVRGCKLTSSSPLITLRLLLWLHLLLPVRLLLVAGHNNLPASLVAATKEKRSEIRMCMKNFILFADANLPPWR